MQYSLELITPSADLDLTDEFNTRFKIYTGSAEDATIAQYINTATKAFEEEAKLTLLATTYDQYEDKFNVKLAKAKVQSITSVKYHDSDDVQQTLSAFHVTNNPNGWTSDLTGITPCVYLPNNAPPDISIYRLRPVVVRFVAGSYANQAAIPDDIITAILLLAGTYYEYRESHTTDSLNDLPLGFKNIALKYNTGLHSL